MRQYGYKKDALTFRRGANGVVFVVNFQKSGGNQVGHLRFYINCGIYSPLYARFLRKTPVTKPKEYECQVRYRADTITGSAYHWFQLEDWEDNDLRQAVMNDLGKVEQFFTTVTGVQDMIPLTVGGLPKDAETIATVMALHNNSSA